MIAYTSDPSAREHRAAASPNPRRVTTVELPDVTRYLAGSQANRKSSLTLERDRLVAGGTTTSAPASLASGRIYRHLPWD